MENLLNDEAFRNGVIVGVSLYQQKVLLAHEQKKPLKIGKDLYYIQDGRERLNDLIDKICR